MLRRERRSLVRVYVVVGGVVFGGGEFLKLLLFFGFLLFAFFFKLLLGFDFHVDEIGRVGETVRFALETEHIADFLA